MRNRIYVSCSFCEAIGRAPRGALPAGWSRAVVGALWGQPPGPVARPEPTEVVGCPAHEHLVGEVAREYDEAVLRGPQLAAA